MSSDMPEVPPVLGTDWPAADVSSKIGAMLVSA
jgi:hypothetical protein